MPDSDLLTGSSLEKIGPACQDNSPQPRIANSVPETQSAFIGVHNEPLSVVAVWVQSKSFAGWNQSLRPSPKSNRPC
jgi:hypothetical protein